MASAKRTSGAANQMRLSAAFMWETSFTIKPAFACIVAVLQRNHDALHLAQQHEGDDHRKRQPEHDMHPDGRRKTLIEPKRQPDDKEAVEQPAIAATWAAALQPDFYWVHRRKAAVSGFRHDGLPPWAG